MEKQRKLNELIEEYERWLNSQREYTKNVKNAYDVEEDESKKETLYKLYLESKVIRGIIEIVVADLEEFKEVK